MGKKRYIILAAGLVLIIALCGIMCKVLINPQKKENVHFTPPTTPTMSSDINADYDEDGGPIIIEGMFIGAVPGNVRPIIMVNGTRYHWMGRSVLLEGAEVANGLVRAWVNVNYFPKDYTEYGNLGEITDEEPTKDGQMKAAFEASGTIYTNELTPDAVYVWMADGDNGEGRYIRFISDRLDNGQCIRWNGTYYQIRPDECEELAQVPESCVSIGTLHYVGIDKMPENDLETNCPNDTRGYAFEGREVFYDVKEPNFIYVYEQVFGETGRVYKCLLWEE